MVIPAGTLLDSKINACFPQQKWPEERPKRVRGVRHAQAWDSLCIQPNPDLKILQKADTEEDTYYSPQKYYAFENLSEKMWALWLRFSAMSSNTVLSPSILVTRPIAVFPAQTMHACHVASSILTQQLLQKAHICLQGHGTSVCKSFLSPPCSSGCRRFHSMSAPNTSFSHERWNLQGMQGDMIARGSGQEGKPSLV